MAYIRTRKTSSGKTKYLAQVRLKGHPITSATFSRKTDAQKWAQDTESAIRNGKYFRTSEAQRHTVGELVDRYIRDVLPRKPKSETKQRAQLLWWKARIGQHRLSSLTPPLIAEQRDILARDREAATCNRYLAVLSHACNIATREWDWLDENPCRKVTRLPEPRGRVRYLSDDERDRLLAACKESPSPLLYPIVLVALTTGARQGEILNLRWSEVDLERGVIRLLETKNDERRAVPISGPALEKLKRLSKVRRIDTDLVFPHPSKPEPVTIRTHWDRALKDAHISDFRFHDLRHSAASYLAMSGATLAEIAAILGHKTLAMVKRYSHLSDTHTSAVSARMVEKFLA